MTRALTLEDIDRLGELLASISEPFVPMEPDMLDGYLTAIALLRHPPRIEDWIGLVFDIEGRTRASLASEEMQHELRKLVLARGAEIEQLILTQKPIDPIIFEDEPENPDDPFDALHPFADGFALACSNWPELMKNTSKAVQAALVGVLRYESPDENTPDDEQEVAASIEEDMAFADLDEALADLTACVQEIAEVTRAEDIERMQSTTKKAAARKPPRRR